MEDICRLYFENLPCTIDVGFGSAEIGHKPSTLCLPISHHLEHHGVCGGNKSAGPESPTKPTQFMHQAGLAVVNVQIVVAALWVSLQVENAEIEHDHVSLRDLKTRANPQVTGWGSE